MHKNTKQERLCRAYFLKIAYFLSDCVLINKLGRVKISNSYLQWCFPTVNLSEAQIEYACLILYIP